MERVVIIGAGPAGLAAAYHLLKNGEGKYQVTILEATEEIGGISRTVNYKGNRMDIGGHRFFTKDPDVKAWWEELLPLQGALAKDDTVRGRAGHLTEGGPDPETEDEAMLVRQRISRIFYRRHFFDYPVTLNMATIRNLGPVTCVEAGLSYLKSCVFKKRRTAWRTSTSTVSGGSSTVSFSSRTPRRSGACTRPSCQPTGGASG